MKTPEQVRIVLANAVLLRDKGRVGFTTKRAPGAWPNGTRVVKTKMGEGDAHGVGSTATIIGSIGPAEHEGRMTFGYFVLWDSPPADDVPVFIIDDRIAPVQPP